MENPSDTLILIVEPDAGIRQLMVRVLEHRGCHVRVCATLNGAVDTLEREPIGAVLASENLGSDREDVVAVLRRATAAPIALTVDGIVHDRSEERSIGGESVWLLGKPFGTDALLLVLQHLMTGQGALPPA